MRSVLALLLLARLAVAQDVVVPRIPAPTIDGRLDDPAWTAAADLGAFTIPETGQPPAKPVTARCGFDDQALYLAIRCAEPRPDRIKAAAQPGSRDVWQDDCVEVWLRTTPSPVEAWQFIVNARGVRQAEREQARLSDAVWQPAWSAATQLEAAAWTAELAIPWSAVESPAPLVGERFGLKLGREDYAGGPQALSGWPAHVPYGGLTEYGGICFERINLLTNADLRDGGNGRFARWSFSEDGKDAAFHAPADDQGRRGFAVRTQGRYMAMNQDLKLRPARTYELSADVRGEAGLYLRARTVARPGAASTRHDCSYHPTDPAQYVRCSVRFVTGPDGGALIVLGSTEGDGLGTVYVSDLTVRQVEASAAGGPAIPVTYAEPRAIAKLLVTDCRFSRGFCGTAVDGTTESLDWDASAWEWGNGHAGAGVGYDWRGNQGVHLTFADARGFDWLLVRGGVKAKLHGPGAIYDDPNEAPLLATLPGGDRRSRALLDRRAAVAQVSFFDLEGPLADVQFDRIESDVQPFSDPLPLSLGGPADAAALTPWLETWPEPERTVLALGSGAEPLRLPLDRAVHFVSAPLEADTPTTGLGLTARILRGANPLPLTVLIHDPLDPRLVLQEVDLDVRDGVRIVLDYPDQVWPAGARLWLTLRCAGEVELSGPDGGAPLAQVFRTTLDKAVPEALAYRKLLMRTFFSAASEARPWTGWRPTTDLPEWAKTNHWGAQVLELCAAIDQCSALDPQDDLVRQYREWVYRGKLRPELKAAVASVPGAPEWAVTVHQAWLMARDVARWWIDNRMVPTGEFGGLVGDDSDLYQNLADLPLFEDGGVGAAVRAGGERLCEWAFKTTLEGGLNRRTMDPLHAYEEGINQEALMAFQHYGDPYYLEHCLEGARNTEKLTVVNAAGHRHFKAQRCGAEDLRIDRPTDEDGDCHPLLWHTTLESLWYASNPRLQAVIDGWADAWLAHQKPGEGAIAVETASDKVTRTETSAFRSGYGTLASVMISLFQITGELKYLAPLIKEWRTQGDSREGRQHLPDFAELLPAGTLGEKQTDYLCAHLLERYRLKGDREAALQLLRNDIAELQRFPAMYTTAEPFTDRIFLYALVNPATCYLGGSWTRNRFERDHAVSWSGFGTDYAAMVQTNRRDAFRVALYNFADHELRGEARLWRLDHGIYQLRYGPDADGDDRIDQPVRDEAIEAGRGTRLPVTLPPRRTMLLELQQTAPLDDLRLRTDLALSPREVAVQDGRLTGIVHNVGGAAAPTAKLVLLDPAGKPLLTVDVPPLEAPLDLLPKRWPFELKLPAGFKRGEVALVPAAAEITADNDRVTVAVR